MNIARKAVTSLWMIQVMNMLTLWSKVMTTCTYIAHAHNINAIHTVVYTIFEHSLVIACATNVCATYLHTLTNCWLLAIYI